MTRAFTAAAVTACLCLGCLAAAQDTTATVEVTEAATTTESLAPLAVMTPEPEGNVTTGTTSGQDMTATQTIVLLGEKVSQENPDSATGPFPELAELTRTTIGGRVVDLTTHGLTIEDISRTIGKAVIQRPDVVIVFTGFTDEKKETEDQAQRDALATVVEGLEKSGAKIFLVPASTTVGAMTSANLRLVATELGVYFVPIGTEVGGQPFIDAFTSVNEYLAAPPEEAPAPVEAPAPATAVTIQGGKISGPGSAPAEAKVETYDSKKAAIQKELDRIAGQSGDEGILPSLEDTVITTESLLNAQPAGTTIPEGGTLTKRGKEAQESINMRPLPAVKAFRPSIPVPRNRLDTKEPGLSR